MIRYGSIIDYSKNREEEMDRLDDRIDNILYKKPVVLVKKIGKFINKK